MNRQLGIQILLILIAGIFSDLVAQNAPVTSIPGMQACPGRSVEIPVIVSGFTDIGAVSLTLNYDPSVLSFESYTNDSQFPGLTVNGQIEGTVIAGGFSAAGSPGISLPDNTVLFTMTFHYAGGSSGLTWYDNGGSCEYADALYNPLNDSPTAGYYVNGIIEPAFPENAPLTFLPTMNVCEGLTVEVPVTVSDFCLVGALSLTMQYDPAVLTFGSSENSAGFPALLVNGEIPGTVMAGGYIEPGDQGISLPESAVLFTMTFQYNGGTTDLTWLTDGTACEYADQDFNPLNDDPALSYYFSGAIGPYESENAPLTIAPNLVAVPGDVIEIPVTTQNFCKIGALSLTLNYCPQVLSFLSWQNTSGFPGLLVNGEIDGSVMAAGYLEPGSQGFSLEGDQALFTLTFEYLGGFTPLTWYDNGESCEYADVLFSPLNDSPSSDYYFEGSVSGTIYVSSKLFLEGPFLGGDMSTHLSEQGFLPLNQPFSGSPWNYMGGESVTTFPVDAVDWILLEVRDSDGEPSSASPERSLDRHAALLLKDGTVVAPDGNSILEFQTGPAKEIFILAYHRNHLPVISATPLSLDCGVGSFDFSSSETQVSGGQASHSQLAPGVWGMSAGDMNANGHIDILDKKQVWNDQTGKKGYLPGDVNFDSQVNNPDKNDYLIKNIGRTSAIPQ